MVFIGALSLAATTSARSQEIRLTPNSTPGPTIKTESGSATCADFRQDTDGAWTPLKDIVISTSDGCVERLGAGRFSFQTGISAFCGVDVGVVLNRQCGKRDE
jgi:hypothetical protein